MAEAPVGSERGIVQQYARNSNRADGFSEAVEHDCSVNGSEIGFWEGMDVGEGREEDNEGDWRGFKDINQGNQVKRKKD